MVRMRPPDPTPLVERARQAVLAGKAGPDVVETSEQLLMLASPATLATIVDPTYQIAAHVRLLDQHLVAVRYGDIDRLLVVMPPRHSKSETTSKYFPVWSLRCDPSCRYVLAGYGDDFIRDFGRAGRDILKTNPKIGIQVRSDTKAANRWNLAHHKGGLLTVGVGGPLTGRGANRLGIDDPVKNWQDANSPIIREQHWGWYTSTARTRLQGANSAVVICMTRWHYDDLGGRLLEDQPDRWVTLHLPAIAEQDETLETVTNANPEILQRWEGDEVSWSRKEGEALWPDGPDRFDAEWLAQTKAEVGPWVWSALYQGRPSPAEGGLFRSEHFRYYRKIQTGSGMRWDIDGVLVRPEDCWRFATVDLAASLKTSADYTVIAAWAVAPTGDLLLIDGFRGRIAPEQHWPTLQAMHARWRFSYVGVETVMHGTQLVWELSRSGIPMRELKPDRDKFTRAMPAAARMASGKLWFPNGGTENGKPFIDPRFMAWESELLQFPHGAHDDVVDTISYACQQVAITGPRRFNSRAGFASDDRSADARVHRHLQSLKRPKIQVHPDLGRWL